VYAHDSPKQLFSDYNELIGRARARTVGFVVPEHWGDAVELTEGEGVFIGRYRGQEVDSRGSTIYLFWDEDDQPRFFWSAWRLRQEMERAAPSIGATVCVVRGPNYQTRFDDDGESSGLAYGVESESNRDPLPGSAYPGAPASASAEDSLF
jgi:hypothetical protein